MSEALRQLMEADAAASEKALPNLEELSNIGDLAAYQYELEQRIAKGNALLADLNKKLDHVSQIALPAAMQSAGLKEFILENGAKITIKTDVFASMRADFIPQAVAWLDAHDLGGIVKDEVKFNLGRGEAEKGKQLLLFAEDELGVSGSEKMSVHPGTLKATVKDMRKKGIEFPEEFFSIADKTVAIVKLKS